MSKEITRLKRVLLPRDLANQNFQPTERISLKAMSFRLLAHAEFENYLEDRVRAIADQAHNSWKLNRKVSIVTVSMLSFSTLTLKSPPKSIQAPPNKTQATWNLFLDCSENIKKSFSSYRYYIDQKNHGINEESLLAMLLPIGLEYSVLDPLFIAEINDFAGKRGSVAHKSVAGHVQNGLNPADEAQQADRIRDGLKVLDGELEKLTLVA